MMKALSLILLLGMLAAPAHAAESDDQLPPPPDGKTWHLVWQDEFDGNKLDESITKAKLPDRFSVDYVRVYDLVEKK